MAIGSIATIGFGLRRSRVAKPEWGAKRICQSCDARYYDLRSDPPVCPKCGTTYTTRPAVRQRRPSQTEEDGAVAAAPKKVRAPKKSAAVDDADIDFDDDKVVKDSDDDDALDDEDDDALIEDASDLGEDDDDVSEVMEHLDDEDMSDRG